MPTEAIGHGAKLFRDLVQLAQQLKRLRLCRDYTAGCEPAEQLALGVGLGFGRLLRIGDRDVFGGEVNAAAKLGEDIAAAHEILVTGAVREAAGPDCVFEPIVQVPPGASSAFRLVQAAAAG